MSSWTTKPQTSYICSGIRADAEEDLWSKSETRGGRYTGSLIYVNVT